MSAKSLAKRLVEISARGGSKANTKELMKRWTGFLNEKVRRSREKTSTTDRCKITQKQYDNESMKQEASDLESYLDELKQFEVRIIFLSFSSPFVDTHVQCTHKI